MGVADWFSALRMTTKSPASPVMAVGSKRALFPELATRQLFAEA
jgi:hypothetical protein